MRNDMHTVELVLYIFLIKIKKNKKLVYIHASQYNHFQKYCRLYTTWYALKSTMRIIVTIVVDVLTNEIAFAIDVTSQSLALVQFAVQKQKD